MCPEALNRRTAKPFGRALIQVVVLLLAAAALFTGSTASAAEWYVLCERESGIVVLRQAFDPGTHGVMMGPLPGERTATIWTKENCPGRRCDSSGKCGEPAVETSGDTGGGWVAGEVTSVMLSGGGAAVGPAPVSGSPPGELVGPGAADLTPLIGTARAAAKGCSFPAAFASAEQMASFDPEHPWYLANREKLQELSRRQKRTESLVWQASSALSREELERAHDLAAAAADSAVSCQTQAVSQLLVGIDTAIDQRRQARSAERQRAAAALLPGLIGLSRAISGAQGGAPVDPGRAVSDVAGALGLQLPDGLPDLCAFKLEYREERSTVPSCTCSGYIFDPRQFRCVRR